jgi:hypothetical protein
MVRVDEQMRIRKESKMFDSTSILLRLIIEDRKEEIVLK